jgi:predicted RNase H-like HicB family nuclease
MATRERRQVEDALDLPYAIVLTRAEDGWIARVEELEGCEARGAGPEEAAGAVRAAVADWIGSARAEGRPVPPPHDTVHRDRTRLLALALKANLVVVVVAAAVALGLLLLAWQSA